MTNELNEAVKLARGGLIFIVGNGAVGSSCDRAENTLTAIDNLLSSQSENNCKDAKHPQVLKGE